MLSENYYKGHNLYTGSSSTQCKTSHPSNKQDRNTNPIITRQDYHGHPKIYHFTQLCPSEGEKTQAQVTPSMKPKQTTGPTLPTEGRNQKEYDVKAWENETSNTVS